MRSAVRFALALIIALSGPLAGAAVEDTPPPVLLAGHYLSRIDPAPYWISEKLDGVRAVWDGRTLRFRSGNIVNAPRWFTDALPATPLDGELWLGRNRFERLSGIVRQQIPDDASWREVRYMIFELPGAAGDFSERIAQIRRVVTAAGLPWLQQVEQFRVADRKNLQRRLDEVVKAGGEGLMLHRADAPYLSGRNDALLKLKPLDDAEATVVGHVAGKGRNAGRLGALLMETPEGRRFRIGSGLDDSLRDNPPPVGTLITYRYRGLTSKGLPRFPTYLRVRDPF